MSCSNPFCTCYLEGLSDGFKLGVKRTYDAAYDAGYVAGYTAKSLGHEPPERLRFKIETILKPFTLPQPEPPRMFLPVFDVPRPRRKLGCICPNPDPYLCICGA